MRHGQTAGCLVAFTIASSALLVPSGMAWRWLADGQPPRVLVPELITDRAFDPAAWDRAEVVDEHGLWLVRVAMDCADVDRSERIEGTHLALREIVDGETLFARLRPGRCALLVEAWDRSARWAPVREHRAWQVYADGVVLAADGVHADGAPPTITVGSRTTVVRDDLSGVASIEIRARCGEGWLETVRREAYDALMHEVKLRPLLHDPEHALPWSGRPGPCDGEIVARDHAGHQAESHLRWYRYADAVVPESALLGDIVAPALDWTDALALVDDSGIHTVSATLSCNGSRPRALPGATHTGRVRRLPIAPMLPERLPEGTCQLRIEATDHAGRAAEYNLTLLVDPGGRARLAPIAGDRRPPRLAGPLRTLDDLLHASWLDDEPGVMAAVAEIRCGDDAPIALVPRRFAAATRRVSVFEGHPPPLRGRCVVWLAAVDGEGLTTTRSLPLFGYADGTVVPAAQIDEDDAPALIGLDAAAADGRVTAAEWRASHIVDQGSGLAEVRVALSCRRHDAPVVRRHEGRVVELPLSELIPDPRTASAGRRCTVEVFATDHAGNVVVTATHRARFE